MWHVYAVTLVVLCVELGSPEGARETPSPPRTLTSLPLMDKYVTTEQCIYSNTTSLYTHPIFVKEISSPLALMIILHYCIVPLTIVSKLKMA